MTADIALDPNRGGAARDDARDRSVIKSRGSDAALGDAAKSAVDVANPARSEWPPTSSSSPAAAGQIMMRAIVRSRSRCDGRFRPRCVTLRKNAPVAIPADVELVSHTIIG